MRSYIITNWEKMLKSIPKEKFMERILRGLNKKERRLEGHLVKPLKEASVVGDPMTKKNCQKKPTEQEQAQKQSRLRSCGRKKKEGLARI